jgi:hypothetical protein
MDLLRLFAGLRFHSSNKRPHKSSQRSRRPLVEALEDRSLMSVAADLVAFRPVTEYINYANYPIPAADEDKPDRGPGIRFNGDDDNGIPGRDYADPAVSPIADNDLVRIDVAATGGDFSLNWTDELRVWTTSTKTQGVAEDTLYMAGTRSWWVEYVSPLHSNAALLSLTVSAGADTATDSVLFHSFQSDVIVIGGNTQDPANVGDPRLGVFAIGLTLYQQGYDVHLFSHSQVQSSGQGAAFNEVKSAVLNRNVDYVAILGYSWGGGATYELAAGLKADATMAGQYQLKYTAYIDGIRHGSISAETRLPALTQYHDNFYQRKDWLLKGNSVAGANNVNVTLTTWGKSLVHTTIDDNATLQGLLVNKLMTRIVV